MEMPRLVRVVVAHHFFCDKLPQFAGLGVESLRAAGFGPGVAVIHANQLTVLLPQPRGAALLVVGVCHLVRSLPRWPQTVRCSMEEDICDCIVARTWPQAVWHKLIMS